MRMTPKPFETTLINYVTLLVSLVLADPGIHFGGQLRSARESRAKPESRARSARELRAKPKLRANPEKKLGEGFGEGAL